MTELLILNVGLFLPIVFGGLAASWFGWKLAGSDSDPGGGGSSKIENGPLTHRGGRHQSLRATQSGRVISRARRK